MIWMLIAFFLIIGLYWNLKNRRRFWSERGVKQSNGSIFGDNLSVVLRKESFPEMIQTAYNMFPNTRYSGFYQFFTPVLIARDPDLIKQIIVKEFDHFVNHTNLIPEGSDDYFNKNLFSLKNQNWHNLRTTMSPAFTSSKMKHIFSLMLQTGDRFIQHFLQQEQDVIIVEMKDIFTRFANDVVATTVFGLEINSLTDPENEFYQNGKELTDFNKPLKMLKVLGGFIAPKLYKMFKWSPFTASTMQFLASTIETNLEFRRKNNIMRPDMINILLEAQKHGLKYDDSSTQDTGFATVDESERNKSSKVKAVITDKDIIAQGIGFFFAGFDTVSGLMSFMSYELGINPEVQEKLIREVDKTFDACNGRITYEALLGMKYMDQVVSESLRKWPNAPIIDRVCTKPFNIEPKYPDEKSLSLEEGVLVWIPVFGLHRDPRFFPDPERFDPERFSEENKASIKPYTYLPFGAGPRACLGSRFALIEIKIIFFHILTHFEIIPVEKTTIPLRINMKGLNFTAEGGFWLGLKRRIK